VFESSADAISGIAAGRVRSCDILIVRGDEGFDADSLQAALNDAGLERVTLITDASARDASGAVIGHVAPSAAARGPIAYVNDDDIIHIDLTNGRIDVLADIDLRRGVRTQKPGKAVFGAGALQKYARLVTAAHK
jgi:dihydroxy-acid dehydratase